MRSVHVGGTLADGDSADVSYSATFGQNARTLYDTAASHG